MKEVSLELHNTIYEIRKPEEQVPYIPDSWCVQIEFLYENPWMTPDLIDYISLTHFIRTIPPTSIVHTI